MHAMLFSMGGRCLPLKKSWSINATSPFSLLLYVLCEHRDFLMIVSGVLGPLNGAP